MKNTIYVDILICVNLLVNYFLLLGSVKFLKISFKRLRLILASILGAIYSLYIFLPEINIFLSFFIKILMSATIVLTAFGILNLKIFLKVLACFYSMSFAFCGIIFAIWYFIGSKNLFCKNGIVYFNISPIIFVMTTIISYIIIRLVNKVTGQEIPDKLFYDVLIRINKNTKIVKAKIDTGNNLKEPFSGLPVMVVEKESLNNFITEDFLNKNFRMIPFKTISGEGLLKAFKPDEIRIINKNNLSYEKDGYVALCDKNIIKENSEAIIGLDFIGREV